MTTECTAETLPFQAVARRTMQARFDGGALTSDGGAVLLREVDRATGSLAQFAACFRDDRAPARITHSVSTLVRQRVYGLALGYEDLNDHDQLRHDPLFAVLAEAADLTAPLAGKSTLNRLELSAATVEDAERYKKIAVDHAAVDRLLVDVFLHAHAAAPPAEIVLDLDATDDPVHGAQEGRFFHGYYGHYCYLPLYIFAGEPLLCARLRTADIDASAGALEEVQRIVAQLRAAWPTVRITLRADSGFCRDALMTWAEAHAVDYVFGLARNTRLTALIPAELAAAAACAATGAPARVFAERTYQTLDSWTRARRVVAKAEQLTGGADGKSNPRFVVTSLPITTVDARTLYEDVYCARGDRLFSTHTLYHSGPLLTIPLVRYPG